MNVPSFAAYGVIIFLVSFVVSTGLAVWMIVRLPVDYFVRDRQQESKGRSRVTRWLTFLLRNILGLALIAIGILLSLPGVPGQGLLTILMGIMISDFPGKQRLERRIIGRPTVLHAINRLRERFGKAPLIL